MRDLVHRVVLVLVTLAIACERSQDDGESCIGRHDECTASGDALRICVDGRWTEQSCDELCRQADPNMFPFGCSYRPDADDRCHCQSGDPPAACLLAEPPAPSCVGPRRLRMCVGDDYNGVSCDDVCKASSPDLYDVGCFHDPERGEDACACIREGDLCEPLGYDGCVDDELLHCEAGVWRLTDCAEWCSPEPSNGCVFDDLDLGRCACVAGGSDGESSSSSTISGSTGK